MYSLLDFTNQIWYFEEFAKLVDRNEFAGYHSVMQDASEYTIGIYFYQLTAGSTAETKRLILLK